MGTIEHSDLTDPELHEPKAVEDALVNQVYHANGSGSGEWIVPFEFLETIDQTSDVSEYVVENLSNYSRLMLDIEHYKKSTASADLIIQIYSSSAAAYRTSSYYTLYCIGSQDDSTSETGLMLSPGFSSYQFGMGRIIIDNFNDANYPTFSYGTICNTSTTLLTATSVGSFTVHEFFSFYNTDEQHEKIKFLTSDGSNFQLKGTLIGVRS